MSQAFPVAFADALSPDDLRIAISAYEDACQALDEGNCPLDARADAQRTLAEYIMARMLNGERDATRLRDGALNWLDVAGPTTKESP